MRCYGCGMEWLANLTVLETILSIVTAVFAIGATLFGLYKSWRARTAPKAILDVILEIVPGAEQFILVNVDVKNTTPHAIEFPSFELVSPDGAMLHYLGEVWRAPPASPNTREYQEPLVPGRSVVEMNEHIGPEMSHRFTVGAIWLPVGAPARTAKRFVFRFHFRLRGPRETEWRPQIDRRNPCSVD